MITLLIDFILGVLGLGILVLFLIVLDDDLKKKKEKS